MPMISRELEDECEVNFEEHFEKEEAQEADQVKPQKTEHNEI